LLLLLLLLLVLLLLSAAAAVMVVLLAVVVVVVVMLVVAVRVASGAPLRRCRHRGDGEWPLPLLVADGGGSYPERCWWCVEDRRLLRALLLPPLRAAAGCRTPLSAMAATAGMSMLADRAIGRRASGGTEKRESTKTKRLLITRERRDIKIIYIIMIMTMTMTPFA